MASTEPVDSTPAGSADADVAVGGVVAAERERCRATSERDWPALDALLDDAMTHTHMNGRVDTKAALLENVAKRPRTLRRGELSVRLYGSCAVMTGPQYLDLGAGEVLNQATQTWVQRDGRWVLVAFHASTDDPTPRSPAFPNEREHPLT